MADGLIRTVGTGGQHSTINEALAFMSKHRPYWSADLPKAQIKLLSGFVMHEEVHLRNGVDFGWVSLTSEDERVRIDSDALNSPIADFSAPDGPYSAFLAVRNSILPIMDVLFDFGDPSDKMLRADEPDLNKPVVEEYKPSKGGKSAFVILDNSRITFRWFPSNPKRFGGCLRVNGYGLYVGHVSDANAYKTRFDNSHVAFRVANQSRVYARYALANNCNEGAAVGDGGLFYANDAKFDEANINGIRIEGGIAWLDRVCIRGSRQVGIRAAENATVTAPNATISRSGKHAIHATDGSTVQANKSLITKCGCHGILAETGASVTLCGATVESCDGNVLQASAGARIVAVRAALRANDGEYDAFVDGASIVQFDHGRTNIATNVPTPLGLIIASGVV